MNAIVRLETADGRQYNLGRLIKYYGDEWHLRMYGVFRLGDQDEETTLRTVILKTRDEHEHLFYFTIGKITWSKKGLLFFLDGSLTLDFKEISQ
jgi:hypothetical protein